MRNRLMRLLWRLGMLNVARAVRHPLRTIGVRRQKRKAQRWSQSLWQPTEVLARNLDAELWRETEAFSIEFERQQGARFEAVRSDFMIGGPGEYRLLYFLTRLLQPETVVETGVAGGWSSAAILSAMERNGKGHLWSSELVYRDRDWLTDDYQRFVGYVVTPELRQRWTLLMEGDDTNLPVIVDECGPIGLFHYDSDKSFQGRQRALELVEGHLPPSAPIVIDDINDNDHFREFVKASRRPFTVVGRWGTVGISWDRLSST